MGAALAASVTIAGCSIAATTAPPAEHAGNGLPSPSHSL